MTDDTQQGPSAVDSWSGDYLETQYEAWRRNPESVSQDWREYFQSLDNGAPPPAAADVDGTAPIVEQAGPLPVGLHRGRKDWGDVSDDYLIKQSGVYSLIVNYRMLGHFVARLDPLGNNQESHPLLALKEFGLSDEDLDTEFDASTLHPPRRATLREILEVLRTTYSGSLGAEYLHIQNTPERRWIQDRLEPIRSKPTYSKERHRTMLKKLRLAHGFERYLHTKYIGQKRFSLEGGESAIVAFDSLIRRAADVHGCSDVIFGMAHRGRLNVLANIMDKSYQIIFSEFEDNFLPLSSQGDGDVKYHKGYSSDYTTSDGNEIHLTLTANPSHLEAVDPVVEGRSRAKQSLLSRRSGYELQHPGKPQVDQNGCGGASRYCEPTFPTPDSRRQVVPVLVHGDAAFAAQGVVWETLNLSKLEAYTTGGTVHIIINNQVGFTTTPEDARSTYYCTDVVKGIEAPIFHVNGDDVEAVAFVIELALDYRQQFGKDVVIDIICYRKWGHNEADEPAFTQPLMYEKIEKHPGTVKIYTESLIERGLLTEDELEKLDEEIHDMLSGAQQEAKSATRTQIFRMIEDQAFGGEWKKFKREYSHEPVDTGVPYDTLLAISERLSAFPEGFHPHPKLERLQQKKLQAVQEREKVDWPAAEALAFGSLLMEGVPVRMSGQDSRRGTFSQRHAVLVDVENEAEYTPLNNVSPGQALFEIYDSCLSELAVVGFEYGVTLGDPHTLVLWEAQFGDFVNGAQVIIDQFLTSGQSKWDRHSGFTMLLPHGYEGQGPEHSSGRLERFLQLCAEENLQVCNFTTPAQYFHALRRQMKRDFRRPLIVMTPKSLLRHPRAQSPVDDFVQGYFREVIEDRTVEAADVRRVLVCSGKVYYDLLAEREEKEVDDVAIVRLEQFYPLNEDALKNAVHRYSNASEFYWVQEEPSNMGGWTFIGPRLRSVFGNEFGYIGRDEAASPATGSLHHHKIEQGNIVKQAVEERRLAPAGVRV